MKKILIIAALLSTMAAATTEVEICELPLNEINTISHITVMCVDRKMVMVNPNHSTTQLFDSTGKSLKETYCSCAETVKGQ